MLSLLCCVDGGAVDGNYFNCKNDDEDLPHHRDNNGSDDSDMMLAVKTASDYR